MDSTAKVELGVIIPVYNEEVAISLVLDEWRNVLGMSVGKKHLRFAQFNVALTNRQTGEVSIKKWKLLKSPIGSFWQTIHVSLSCKVNDIYNHIGKQYSIHLKQLPSIR